MRVSRLSAARLTAGLTLALLTCSLFLGAGARLQAQSTGVSVTYPGGVYSLVSGPPGSDFSGALALYTFQPGNTEYQSIQPGPNTATGFGYFAYFANPTTVALAAGSNAPYSVNAPANQYFQIGDPSGTQSATVSGADVVYVYDPTQPDNPYTAVTTLTPGQGAWAISTSGGTITVTPNGAPVPTPTPAGLPPQGATPPAARFFGSVMVRGAAAAAGTPITATASNGAPCGTSAVGAAPASGSNYALDITGSDPGCTTPGSTISFSVGGTRVAQTGQIPDVSGAVPVNLSQP